MYVRASFFVTTRRTYHNTREEGDHSNMQWLLHDDPAYTSEDIDDTVLRRLLKGLRSVSPYVSRQRLAHNNRCDHVSFYCEITTSSTCHATTLHASSTANNYILAYFYYLCFSPCTSSLCHAFTTQSVRISFLHLHHPPSTLFLSHTLQRAATLLPDHEHICILSLSTTSPTFQ